MKTILRTLTAVLVSAMLLCPDINAQNRGRGRGGGSAPTHSSASRPNTSSQPGNNGQRPGNNGQQPGNSGQRPGNNGQRPGNNRPTVTPNRPGNGNNTINKPNKPNNNWHYGNDRPGGPGGPGNTQPQRPQQFGGNNHGPMRPHMKPHTPFFRPTPPPSWRPSPSWRPLRSILGITLGTAFNISVNALINNGYSVASYGNNQIYLNNVPMLNLIWPDAIMYYNNAGTLYGSRFIYSTSGYNMNQYNMAYTTLTATYGAPVSMQNLSNGVEATWWGPGNQFIRLSYLSDYANNGLMRYYTTLSFGN